VTNSDSLGSVHHSYKIVDIFNALPSDLVDIYLRAQIYHGSKESKYNFDFVWMWSILLLLE